MEASGFLVGVGENASIPNCFVEIWKTQKSSEIARFEIRILLTVQIWVGGHREMVFRFQINLQSLSMDCRNISEFDGLNKWHFHHRLASGLPIAEDSRNKNRNRDRYPQNVVIVPTEM
jgi:hypothetical protein